MKKIKKQRIYNKRKVPEKAKTIPNFSTGFFYYVIILAIIAVVLYFIITIVPYYNTHDNGVTLTNNNTISQQDLAVARFQLAVVYVYPNLTDSQKLDLQRYLFLVKAGAIKP